MPTIGPSNASSFSSDAANGGTKVWSSPERAESSDDSKARASAGASTGVSEYLKALSIADFSEIPDTAIVPQVVVEVEKSSPGNAGDSEAKLVVAGVVQTDNQAESAFFPWPASDAYSTYTFTVDLTGAQAKAADFGFVFAASLFQEFINAFVDHIRFTASYFARPFETEDLRTYLLADTVIAGLVGARCRPGRLMQQDSLPAIRYAFPSGGSVQHLSGISGTATPTLQVDCYASNWTDAWMLGELVRLRLQSFAQAYMGSTWVEGFLLTGRHTTYENPVDAGDHGKHRVILTFDVAHSEATE
jgi:hypothetical protein